MKSKSIFCANCQGFIGHSISLNSSKTEIIATCKTAGCGRQVKFPTGITADEFNRLVADHNTNNAGHVVISTAAQKEEAVRHQQAEDLLSAITDSE